MPLLVESHGRWSPECIFQDGGAWSASALNLGTKVMYKICNCKCKISWLTDVNMMGISGSDTEVTSYGNNWQCWMLSKFMTFTIAVSIMILLVSDARRHVGRSRARVNASGCS